MDQLTATLKKIEKQNYRAYQQIKGQYDFGDFDLYIDYVQGDPYASASRLRATRAWSLTGLEWLKDESPAFQRAARDFIARSFDEFAKQENAVSISLSGQTVLDNTAVLFTEEGIELRFRVNLPAEGRSVLGKKANNILTFYLPKFIRRATLERELNKDALIEHCKVVEDQASLREQLEANNLVAFVANGSVLPRIAGNCDLPMKDAVEFKAPESLQVTLHAPNKGYVTGLGIPKGITLIVGGGFHGKSTLLNAVERSIYDHIPGDGREYIVTDANAMKIRAEDGRCVHHLNLSNYINHLPMGKDTADFSTQDASGSTSQAAWLQESIEAGASSLLIDEDTSATNFMIRDERMQALVAKGDEPITPLVDRIGQLRDELEISTIIVMGGSGDYLDVADTVIQMHDYQAVDVTEKAKEVIAQHPTQRHNESEESLQTFRPRALNRVALMNILTDGKFRVNAKGKDSLRFGKEFTDLSALEQLESADEVNTIGWLWFQIAQLPGWCNHPAKEMASSMDAKSQAYLEQYLQTLSQQEKDAIPSVSADYYCADEHNANACAELVRIGQKTASCSMELWYSEQGEMMPQVGHLQVVTNWDGEPVCVIRITDVRTCRYADVSEEFAHAEGEGDRTMAWWRKAHTRFFKAECEELGIEWHEQRLLLLERFEVVYPQLK